MNAAFQEGAFNREQHLSEGSVSSKYGWFKTFIRRNTVMHFLICLDLPVNNFCVMLHRHVINSMHFSLS